MAALVTVLMAMASPVPVVATRVAVLPTCGGDWVSSCGDCPDVCDQPPMQCEPRCTEEFPNHLGQHWCNCAVF
jgi:hypothetical protein